MSGSSVLRFSHLYFFEGIVGGWLCSNDGKMRQLTGIYFEKKLANDFANYDIDPVVVKSEIRRHYDENKKKDIFFRDSRDISEKRDLIRNDNERR
jgi:hypothetical protein